MRIVQVLSVLLCMAMLFMPNMVHAESTNLLLKVSDIDDGYWVEMYQNYLQDYEQEYIDEYGAIPCGATLADLNIDGIPELIVICETGSRASGYGHIVSLADSIQINDFAYEGTKSTFALCSNDEGEIAWYEQEESVATWYKDVRINQISIDNQLAINREEWFSVSYEAVYDEATDEEKMVATAYYISGNEVDYDTYRQEELKRRRLITLYTFDVYTPYPNGWDEMVSNACVFNTAE